MRKSDVFVHLDDVEYSKNSFHNRNRIKSSQGALTLTVPVLYKGHSKEFISQIRIDNKQDWRRKHWVSIEMNYSKAPYFAEIAPQLKEMYEQTWEVLGDLNMALIEFFRSYLGIDVECYRSSDLVVEGTANEKLVNICEKLGVDRFLVKFGTEHYHPSEYFASNGIQLQTFAYASVTYRQLYGNFIPNLSILDYAMNCGRRLW